MAKQINGKVCVYKLDLPEKYKDINDLLLDDKENVETIIQTNTKREGLM